MACPYFDPLAPEGESSAEALASGSAWRDAMLPLGNRWRGLCRAGATAAEPGENVLPQCNLGYARGICPRFPAEGPDAVRFTVQGETAGVLRLYYVIERDHHPFAHGPCEEPAGPADSILARQARAYAASYRLRKRSSA